MTKDCSTCVHFVQYNGCVLYVLVCRNYNKWEAANEENLQEKGTQIYGESET